MAEVLRTDRRMALLAALFCACGTAGPGPDGGPGKPSDAGARTRLVVLTDIGADPDDEESMVRLLAYANEIDIEALIATTSVWLRTRVNPEHIRQRIHAYGMVRASLAAHAPEFPTVESLLDRVFSGPPVYGMSGVGSGKDTAASDMIVSIVDRPDPRPVWVSVWGGPNVLAQALWKVRQTRPQHLAAFVKKLRVYTISDQDDSGPWMRRTFPDLFYVCSPSDPNSSGGYAKATWTGISGERFFGFAGPDPRLVSHDWIRAHVRGHGPLGELYPLPPNIMEGDTPAFLGLIRNGLNVPERPDYGGWGGRYVRSPFWTDSPDTVTGVDGRSHTQAQATIWRWREAYQNDFQARMDWQVSPRERANHPPIVRVDGPLERTVRSGWRVSLDARASSDPDGNALAYRWSLYPEAGTFRGAVPIDAAATPQASLVAPAVTTPQTVHVILTAKDDGVPPLFRYARVVLHVAP